MPTEMPGEIHTKLVILCAVSSILGGMLGKQKDLAAAMQLAPAMITNLYGYGREREPFDFEKFRIAKLVELFKEQGKVVVEPDWFLLPTEEFRRRVYMANNIGTRRRVSWSEFARRQRPYPGLCLRAAPTSNKLALMLREEGERPPPLPPSFRVGDRAELLFSLPAELRQEPVMVVVLHESSMDFRCLYPAEEATPALLEDGILRLPANRGKFFVVDPPNEVQRVYAAVSRHLPQPSVHSGLEAIDLHIALDDFATSLDKQADGWHLFSFPYQVDK